MTKSLLNKHVRTSLTKRLKNSNIEEADAVIDVFTEAMIEALAENEEILLVGFGRFIKAKAEARTVRNPKTGDPMKVPSHKRPRFKAGIKLKEACNRPAMLKKNKK